MKRAVIYARYSCSRQSEQSIEGQLTECYRYAVKNDLQIVHEYIDRATTGRNDNRPAFQEMLKDSKKKKFNCVIVYAIDRFSRDPKDYFSDKYQLMNNGVYLLSTREATDTNPDGTPNLPAIYCEHMSVANACYYPRELSEKIIRGRAESMRKGTFLGGSLLFGYKVIDKKIFIDDAKAEVVRTMFDMYNEGYTIQDIILECKTRGLDFKKTRLLAMLRNEKYIGRTIWNGKVYTNMYPAIVDTAVFASVQDRFKAMQHSPAKLKDGDMYILSRKLFCGLCGSPMYGESTIKNDKKYMYYKCFDRKKNGTCQKKSVKKEIIEDIVVNATIRHILTPKYIDIIVSDIKEELEELKKQSKLTDLEHQYSKTVSEIRHIIDAIKQGIFSNSTKDELNKLEQEKADLELQLSVERSRMVSTDEEDIRKRLQDIARMNMNEPRARILIVEHLIEKIILYDDHIVIFYNHHGDNKEKSELTTRESSELQCLVVGNVQLPKLVTMRNHTMLALRL